MDVYATTLLNKSNELVAKIENTGSRQLIAALMSVVETHTLIQVNRGKSGLRKRCTECGFAYPCPTLQAVEKELISD